jgi:hypothetical protein
MKGQIMYYVTLWCVRVTTFANGKATMRSVCISELSVTVNNMKIVAKKKVFQSEFMSPTTLTRTSCKLSDNFVDFNQFRGFSTYFYKSQYQI